MNDLNCILFYRVTFDVAPAPGIDEGMPQALVSFLREHLFDSWADSGLRLPQRDGAWDALATGGHFSRAATVGSVRVEAALLRSGEDAFLWACRVGESHPAGGVARRTWYTELCLDQRAIGDATLTVLVSYEDLAGFMGPTAQAPDPRVPLWSNVLCAIAALSVLVRARHCAWSHAN